MGKKEGVWGWPVNEDRAKDLSMFACWQGEGGGGGGWWRVKLTISINLLPLHPVQCVEYFLDNQHM